MAARRAVFQPPGRILTLFDRYRLLGECTLNFGPRSTKLVGTIRVTKKMTHIDNGPGPGRNYGETAAFTFCRKVENGPKIRFSPKNHPKKDKRLLFIGGKGTFSFAQLCPVVARTWLESKSGFFFWRISARKSVFSYGTPIFFKGAFVALGVGSVVAPSDLVCDFSFPSYGRFREGTRPKRQKSCPTPL